MREYGLLLPSSTTTWTRRCGPTARMRSSPLPLLYYYYLDSEVRPHCPDEVHGRHGAATRGAEVVDDENVPFVRIPDGQVPGGGEDGDESPVTDSSTPSSSVLLLCPRLWTTRRSSFALAYSLPYAAEDTTAASGSEPALKTGNTATVSPPRACKREER